MWIALLLALVLCTAGDAQTTVDTSLLWDFRFEPGDLAGNVLKNYAAASCDSYAATIQGSAPLVTGSPSALGGSAISLGSSNGNAIYPLGNWNGGSFNGGYTYNYPVGTFVTASSWFHVAFTFGNTPAPLLYINGVLAKTFSTFLPQTTNAYYGAYSTAGTSPWYSSEYFIGYMDDIRLYSRALSASDVSNLYNGVVATPTSLATPGPQITSFCYSGSTATYTVPSGIRLVQVSMCGGAGGSTWINPSLYSGGPGGFISANITVTPGQTLCVAVGQRGGNNPSYWNGASGGWNGGGQSQAYPYSGGGGGGASDIRASCDADMSGRIIVAGGGGGSGSDSSGGAGGGYMSDGGNTYTGTSNYKPGAGASQVSGYGAFGVGGPGLNYDSRYGGGGGGGYYGGSGGYGGAGGGGGSSSCSALQGCSYIANVKGSSRCTGNGFVYFTAFPGSTSMPTPTPTALPTKPTPLPTAAPSPLPKQYALMTMYPRPLCKGTPNVTNIVRMNRCDILTTADGKLTGDSVLYSVVSGMPSKTKFTGTVSCQVLLGKNNSFAPVPLFDPTLAATPCNSCGTLCSVSYTLSTGSMPKSYLAQNNSLQLAYYPTKAACSADFAMSALSTSSVGWTNLLVFSLPMPKSTVSTLLGNPAGPEWAYTKYVALPSCSVGAKGEVLVQAQLYPSSSYSYPASSSSTTQTLSFYGDTGGKLSKTLYITSSLSCSDQAAATGDAAAGGTTSCVGAQQPRISSSSSSGAFLETGDETINGWPFSSSSPGAGTALVDYLDEETQTPITLKSCVLTGPGSLAAKCTLSAKVKIPSGTLINAANTYGAASLVAGSTGCTASTTLNYPDDSNTFVKATCKNPLPPMVPTTQGQYVYRSFHSASKQHCRGATYMWEIEPIVLNGCQSGIPALGSSLRYTCKQGGGDKKNTFTLSKATYASSASCQGASSNEVMRHDTDCSSLDGSRTGCGMLPQEMLSAAHVVVNSYDSAKCGSDLTALRRITVFDVCAPNDFVSPSPSERYRRVVSFVAKNSKKLKLSVRRFAYDDESCSGEQLGKTETVTYMIGASCQADPLYPRAFVKSFSLGPSQTGAFTTLPPTAIPTAPPTPEPSAVPSPAPTAPTAVPTFYTSPDVTTLQAIRRIWQNRLSTVNTLANSTANNWVTPLATLRSTKYGQGYAACQYGSGSSCDRIDCDSLGNVVNANFDNLGLTTAGAAATLQQLAYFPTLTSLTLQSNSLAGTFPSAIGLLTNLRQLVLRYNSITALPSEIGLLTRLTNLDLYSAGLKGSIPTQLGNMMRMVSLDLRSNSLTGSIPTQLGNLGKWLVTLYLDANKLTGQVPSQFLNMKKLTTLGLGQNKLSGTIGAANLCGIPCANGGSLTLLASLSSEQNKFCMQDCMFTFFLPSWSYERIWGYTSAGGAGGHTTQCNTTATFPVSYYPDTPFVVTKNNRIGYVTLPAKFSLSFDINAQEYDGNWHNLLHLSATNTDGGYGGRLPAIYSCKRDTSYSNGYCKYMGLLVSFYASDGTMEVTIPPLTANTWYTITVTVDWTSNMNVLSIGARNSSTVLLRHKIDSQPRLPTQRMLPLPLVHFYASSDWFPEAKASIRNLALTLPLPPLRVNPGRWPEINQGGWGADNAGGDGGQNFNAALSATNSASTSIVITSIMYYKTVAGNAAMTTARVGGVYSSDGTLLGSTVTFTGETGSGWQVQALSTPVTIAPGDTFRVVVNMRSYITSTFPSTTEGIFTNLCSYYSYSATIAFPTNEQCGWNRMVDLIYTT